MLHATCADLIRQSPDYRGVFDPAVETTRRVQCTTRSVGMRESYIAKSHGLAPELILHLAHDFEYQGEKLVLLEGVRYRVLRTWRDETDGIDLTLQREEVTG